MRYFSCYKRNKSVLQNVSANYLVPLEMRTLQEVRKNRVGREITFSKHGLEHQFVNHVFLEVTLSYRKRW